MLVKPLCGTWDDLLESEVVAEDDGMEDLAASGPAPVPAPTPEAQALPREPAHVKRLPDGLDLMWMFSFELGTTGSETAMCDGPMALRGRRARNSKL